MNASKICWIVSYPKSGNTWMRILLGNYLGYGQESEENDFGPVGITSSARGLFDELSGISSSDLSDDEIDLLRPDYYRSYAQAATKTPFIKVHDSYHSNAHGEWLFPIDCTNAAIYIVRNPMDVAVSYSLHNGHENFQDTIDKMNDPKNAVAGSRSGQLRQIMGSWSIHFRSWNEQTDIPLLLIRYEDMLRDTAGQLDRVITFCGLQSKDHHADIERAVEAARFQKLQEREKIKGFRERPKTSSQFFRSGRSGEGENRLSASQKETLVEHHGDVMRQLGYVE